MLLVFPLILRRGRGRELIKNLRWVTVWLTGAGRAVLNVLAERGRAAPELSVSPLNPPPHPYFHSSFSPPLPSSLLGRLPHIPSPPLTDDVPSVKNLTFHPCWQPKRCREDMTKSSAAAAATTTTTASKVPELLLWQVSELHFPAKNFPLTFLFLLLIFLST